MRISQLIFAILALTLLALGVFLSSSTSDPIETPTQSKVRANPIPETPRSTRPAEQKAQAAERTSLSTPVDASTLCRGHIVDDQGKPVARVSLAIWRRGSLIETTSTARDGTFTLTAPEHRDENFIKILDSARCESTAMVGPIAYGRDPIEIKLQRTHTRIIEVRVADSGEAVTEYAVRMRPRRDTNSATGEPRYVGHHPDGKVSISGLWAGDNYLSILPSDLSLAPSLVRTIDPSTFQGSYLIELQRRRSLRVQVVFSDGRPAVGSNVNVIATRGQPNPLTLSIPPGRHDRHLMPAKKRWSREPELMCTGLTDESGTLLVGLPNEAFVITVHKEHAHPNAFIEQDSIHGDSHRLTLPDPGHLRITVKHAFPKDWHWSVSVAGVTKPPQEFFSAKDGEGPFHAKQLWAGRHHIVLRRITPPNLEHPRSSSVVFVDVRPGEQHEITLDVRSLKPATVSGLVTIDGRRAEGSVTLRASGLPSYPHHTKSLSHVPLVDGRFTVENFPLGLCFLTLDADPDLGRSQPLYAPQLSEKVHFGRNDLEFHFVKRTAVFRITNENGEPIRNTKFFVGIGGHREERISDAGGEVTIDYVPRGPKSAWLKLYLTRTGKEELARVRTRAIGQRLMIDVKVMNATSLRSVLHKVMPGVKLPR